MQPSFWKIQAYSSNLGNMQALATLFSQQNDDKESQIILLWQVEKVNAFYET